MRVALQAQRHADNLATLRETGRAPARVSVTCREALHWATLAGARMLGLEREIGSLAPGKRADIVLLRADDLNLAPVSDPVASIVSHAGPANVDTVLVGGRVLKRAGRLLYPDLARQQTRLAETGRRIVSNIRRLH
jgi:cytosine/adenosine deaminase-related metal-dependent hydrolase